MRRKDLIPLLKDNPMSLTRLAQEAKIPPRQIEEDLQHLVKSLKHTPSTLRVIPARCRKCDFTFSEDKFSKPSKCPKCQGTWITEPMIEIREP